MPPGLMLAPALPCTLHASQELQPSLRNPDDLGRRENPGLQVHDRQPGGLPAGGRPRAKAVNDHRTAREVRMHPAGMPELQADPPHLALAPLPRCGPFLDALPFGRSPFLPGTTTDLDADSATLEKILARS